MASYYFFLYLIYGFVYIALGIYVSGRKRASILKIPFMHALMFLAGFGILHGLSEWVTMVVITGLFEAQYVWLFYVKQLLKALSFVCLFLFGLSLLVHRSPHRKRYFALPWLVFLIWLVGMTGLALTDGVHAPIDDPRFNTIMLRYFMGLPAGLMAGVALFRQARFMYGDEMTAMRGRYMRLGTLFLLYGIVDGVFVREMAFQPAVWLNNQLFFELTGIPIQFMKILLGLGILYVSARMISVFEEEKAEGIDMLRKQSMLAEERRKLGVEVHDSIIQHMYAASLKVKILENKQRNENAASEDAALLEDIQHDLKTTMGITREFISGSTLTEVEFDEMREQINELIHELEGQSGAEILIEGDDFLWQRKMSAKRSTNVYYVIREAVHNAVKHANATVIRIRLSSEDGELKVVVEDNGSGFRKGTDDEKEGHIGMRLMKERIYETGGEIRFDSNKQGTAVICSIPWRDSYAG